MSAQAAPIGRSDGFYFDQHIPSGQKLQITPLSSPLDLRSPLDSISSGKQAVQAASVFRVTSARIATRNLCDTCNRTGPPGRPPGTTRAMNRPHSRTGTRNPTVPTRLETAPRPSTLFHKRWKFAAISTVQISSVSRPQTRSGSPRIYPNTLSKPPANNGPILAILQGSQLSNSRVTYNPEIPLLPLTRH